MTQSDVRSYNGAPTLLRGGMRATLYQCTECGKIEETSDAHVHRITSPGGGSFKTRHYPKRRVALLVERATLIKIR